MDSFERELSEQVRRYKHLYDPLLRDHREVSVNSWKEIASTLGKEEALCRKLWKNTRDRFVKAKKKSRAQSGEPGVHRRVPSIVVELEWLSQFVKHREADSHFEFEDDGAELIHEDQKTSLNFCSQDTTRVDPSISSSMPGTLSPSPSGPAPAEMTSPGSSSPRGDSPSPLSLLTTGVAPLTHPGLHSSAPQHFPRPGLFTSPCTTARKKRHATDCVLCVVHQDQERQKLMQQDNADSRFVHVIKDMLANINPVHKPDVKFKIYQLLFEAEKDFPKES
ncbi:uncharacterized protein LOC127367807 [Dicentrarchus labrax]|uniref:uncharacterized protein LOC127367807 n=1 Tax=Dicentrarchus labrax TaxID=13489 RepID=UPI0021F62D53|nr:uncharacterized protein LOC127367807 [Dicentrarchus labrax]